MAQAIEGVVLPASKAPLLPGRLRLTTARDVRRELHRLYALMMDGKVDTDVARAGGFLLRTMLESIRTDEIEMKLAALESMATTEGDE